MYTTRLPAKHLVNQSQYRIRYQFDSVLQEMYLALLREHNVVKKGLAKWEKVIPMAAFANTPIRAPNFQHVIQFMSELADWQENKARYGTGTFLSCRPDLVASFS